MAKILDCVTICAPRIGQEAALYGLLNLSDWVAEKRALMQQRMLAFREAFADPELRYETVSSGAYFGYMRHPFAHETGNQVAQRLLQEQHILCLPGDAFGPGQERYLRFAFANLDAEQMPVLRDRLLASQIV